LVAEVFLIGVQGTMVSLLGQMGSFISGEESRIRGPEVVTI